MALARVCTNCGCTFGLVIFDLLHVSGMTRIMILLAPSSSNRTTAGTTWRGKDGELAHRFASHYGRDNTPTILPCFFEHVRMKTGISYL